MTVETKKKMMNKIFSEIVSEMGSGVFPPSVYAKALQQVKEYLDKNSQSRKNSPAKSQHSMMQ